MKDRRIAVLALLVVCSSPAVATAQEQLSPDAEAVLSHLRATSSPELRTVARSGRLTFVGNLYEPVSATAPEAAAREFLGRFGTLASVVTPSDLSTRVIRDVGGTTFVRFDAEHMGRRIIGSQVVVAMRDGAVRQVASGLRPVTDVVAERLVRPAVAVRAVEAWSGRGAGDPTEEAWLSMGGRLLPVYIVPQREAGHDWRYVVEATTGTVIWRHDQFIHADGYVWETNPERSGDEVTRVELPRLESEEVLEGSLARAFQCVGETGDCSSWRGECVTCGQREHFATASTEGDFLYMPSEPDREDPFAEVQAYYHADRVNSFFEEELGFARRCEGNRAIDIHVNYYVPGDTYSSANAFYGDVSGDGCGDITLGEGLNIDFSYDADVIYHEFTHGIVEAAGGLGCYPMGVCTDDLGLDWTSIGLNEGYADYYAVTLTDDPSLGEHAGAALSSGEGMIRDAENDHLCPFDLIGESHYDGQIWLGAAWEVREVLGAHVADVVMLRVLNALPQNADYAEAGAALLESTRAAVMDGDATEEQFEQVDAILGPEGRRITGCERIVPLDAVPEGHHEEYMMLQSYGMMDFPAGLQWSLTTTERPGSIAYTVEHDPMYAAPDSLVVHVRRGEPVGVIIVFNPGVGINITYEEDFSAELTDGTFELTPESDPPLEPESTYYFVLEYTCTRGCLLRASGEVESAPNESPVAAAGEDQVAEVEATVSLDGSASYDPEGDELTFTWTVESGPEVTLEGADTATPSFVVTEAGEHVLELMVEDTMGAIGTDTVTITVAEPEEPDDDERAGGCGCRTAGSRTASISSIVRALLP